MPYVATINTPGYLPEDDDPPIFDTLSEAWSYLADERWDALPDTDEIKGQGHPGPDETYRHLLAAAAQSSEAGTVYGSTPGYEGDHDLGKAYCVTEVEVEYRVVWEIDVSAATPRQAAERALEIQRRPSSIAVVFDVIPRKPSGNPEDARVNPDEDDHEIIDLAEDQS